MNKFSEELLNNLNEMEFLTKSLAAAQLHYSNNSQNLAEIIYQTKICLINATLDLAIDLEYKINQHAANVNFAKLAVENLNKASKNLHYFPVGNKITQFDEIEMEILMIMDFIKQYLVNSEQIVENLSPQDKKILSNKFLTIKSRRTI